MPSPYYSPKGARCEKQEASTVPNFKLPMKQWFASPKDANHVNYSLVMTALPGKNSGIESFS